MNENEIMDGSKATEETKANTAGDLQKSEAAPENATESAETTGSLEEDCADPAISADPGADPDIDSDTAPQQNSTDGLDELRRELNALREEIAARENARARMEHEYAEFRSLYPNVSAGDIPDSVWKEAEKGISLAGAYALEERRRSVLAECAEKSNKENRARTTGGVKSAPREYFSRGEVMSMSRSEVHEHFQTILRSMKSWS